MDNILYTIFDVMSHGVRIVPTAAVNEAIEYLRKNLLITRRLSNGGTHTAVHVSNVDQTDIVEAIGTYIVGIAARVISVNLRVRTFFFGSMDGATNSERISEYLKAQIGENNGIPQKEKDDERNPWLAEAISHLVIAMDSSAPLILPHTSAAAIQVHNNAKDKGLDVVALCNDVSGYYVLIGETKATHSNHNEHIGKAVELFSSIDSNDAHRLSEIDHALNYLIDHVPPDQQRNFANSVWMQQRAYLPLIVTDASANLGCFRKRQLIGELKPSAQKKILVHIEATDFHKFFDNVSESARNKVALVVA